jgi:CCR4-NOT transcription complex subunit 2
MFNPREPLTLSSPGLGSGRSGATPAQQKRLKDMSSREFHGLTGLAALIDPSHPDHNPYHIGHDITQLGLDLNSSEPLHKIFSTPFGPSGSTSRPAVPDFTLPASYKVANVPPLHTKIASFSDEALFACFYQHPRDLAQELAAAEL